MCGICGIIGNHNREIISRMIEAMPHRGPDDAGVFAEDGISLGMARLAIIDTSAAGHQPMSNPEQTLWIVYNGEIYNFQEERELLEKKGYTFCSHTDTEVILRMYEQYGDEFLSRLRGMFALVIYDKRRGPGKERFLLARDRFGIKPLLYADIGGRFVFASEMKTMLASGLIEKAIDPQALGTLLVRGSVAQPLTIVSGVKMLLPAHKMVLDESGQKKISCYWKFQTDRFTHIKRLPYPEIVALVKNELEHCVRLQMISDVPVGAFLSGGIDSSLLVALMSRLTSHPVRTISVGFEQEFKHLDETDDSLRLSKFLGTNHYRMEVTGKDLRNDILHIASALDQPSVDGVNSYYVSLAASKVVTVVLSGTGGDELFAGYPWFFNLFIKYPPLEHARLKMLIQQKVSSWAKKLWGKPLLNTSQTEGFLQDALTQYQLFEFHDALQLMSSEISEKSGLPLSVLTHLELSDELSDADPLERVTAFCLRGYTQNQLLRDIDVVSMIHSIEVRVPYLDKVLTDVALSLPADAKWQNRSPALNPYTSDYKTTGSKKILFDIGKEFLPSDMDLQVKRGFGMPFGNWLQTELREVMEDALSYESVARRGLFHAAEVDRVKNHFLEGNLGWAYPWLLVLTELWCRETFDKSSH